MLKFICMIGTLIGTLYASEARATELEQVTPVLSTTGKIYKRIFNGVPVQCAVLREIDVSSVFPDKRKSGCWCMTPTEMVTDPKLPPSAFFLFVLTADKFCQSE